MINLNTSIKSVHLNEETQELEIAGRASTPATDRAMDVILAEAWAKGGIDNYRKNPILLFNHNYNEPIGKVTDLTLDGEGLHVKGVVFEGSKAYPLIKYGVLKTFSVGFLVKDADYNRATDGLIIKEAELLEISVVSVPCNQEATFEVSKSYSSDEFEDLKKKFGKSTDKDARASSNKTMDEKEVQDLIAKAMADARDNNTSLTPEDISKLVEDTIAAREKAAEEARKKAEAEEMKEKEIEERVRAAVTKSQEEKLTEAVQAALEKQETESAKTIAEMSEQLKKYGEQIEAFNNARGGFFPDRGEQKSNWIENKQLREEAIDTFLLGKALNKPLLETSKGMALMEKVNTDSSVQVSSDTFEQLVSTEIYRDIEQELVLAPLFREITLRSASQLITIAPDTGYATHQASGSALPGTAPNGLLNEKGGTQPYTLSEVTLRTDKLVSKAFLANDTEEDAILPILPLIRDGMIRQHAKSVDQMILNAGVVGGTYPSMVSKGLLNYAATQSRTVEGPSAAGTGTITSQHLLAARRAMGKYGLNPNDLVFVVSTKGYYDLLLDTDFYNNNEVGQGTKVTGEVGRMFGTRVIVSAEMSDTVAADAVPAMCLNTRNFVVPRLRGLTSESEYSVDDQHWLLATTQRLGFQEIIPNAPSVVAVDYAI